jgi:hypothetical protein
MSQRADNQKKSPFSDVFVQDLRFDWEALIADFSADEKASAAVFNFLLGRYSEEHRLEASARRNVENEIKELS